MHLATLNRCGAMRVASSAYPTKLEKVPLAKDLTAPSVDLALFSTAKPDGKAANPTLTTHPLPLEQKHQTHPPSNILSSPRHYS